ncbi:MAG: ATP synthase F1 subunit delta, partial [Desulfocucumaceae bacterium]
MINRTVPRRYAQALLMIAVEHDALEKYEQQMDAFKEILLNESNLKEFMDNPKILAEEKKKVLRLLDQIIVNFLCLIIDKRREQIFLDIVEEFRNYVDQARNIVDAEVCSAVQITDKDFRELEQKLSKATGKKVRMKSTIDTSLLGGMIVRIGDTVIDGSVVKKLSLLKNRLQ